MSVVTIIALFGGIAFQAEKNALANKVLDNERHIEENQRDIRKAGREVVEIKQDLKYLIKKVDEISEDVKEHKRNTGN